MQYVVDPGGTLTACARWTSIFVSMYPGNGHEWGGALLADYGNVNWSDIHHYYVIVLTTGAYYSTSTNCSTGGYLSILARVTRVRL